MGHAKWVVTLRREWDVGIWIASVAEQTVGVDDLILSVVESKMAHWNVA